MSLQQKIINDCEKDTTKETPKAEEKKTRTKKSTTKYRRV